MKRIQLLVFGLAYSVGAMAGDFRFEYEPRELATVEGLHQVYDRLESEAHTYCRKRFPITDLVGLRHCQNTAVGQTVEMIGNPQLVAYAADGRGSSS